MKNNALRRFSHVNYSSPHNPGLNINSIKGYDRFAVISHYKFIPNILWIFRITFDILINTLECLETRRLTRELRSLVRCCLNPQLAFGSRSVASLVRLRLTCSSPSPFVRLFGFASLAHSGRLWHFLLCFLYKKQSKK